MLSKKLAGIGRFYLHTSTSSLSVKEDVLQNISVYKINNITLRIAGLPEESATIKLYTLLGKQIIQSSSNAKRIRDIYLPKLAQGIYIVEIETMKGKINKKIIIE
jgi:hypothetical protein